MKKNRSTLFTKGGDMKLADDFERFHRLNPHIFAQILEACDKLWAAGVNQASIKLIFERLRWNHLITHRRNLELNNNYHAFYARLVMAACWTYTRAGFFTLRDNKSVRGWTADLDRLGVSQHIAPKRTTQE